MSNQTIHELTNLSEISTNDELPIWDNSAGATKKVSVEELSLAVNNTVNSYSTEEVNTGKKWIDGKPIYRIVLTTTANISGGDTSFGGLQTDVANLNIDTVIRADGIDNNNRKTYRTLYFSSSSGFGPYSSGMLAGSKIILEYTKTTD